MVVHGVINADVDSCRPFPLPHRSRDQAGKRAMQPFFRQRRAPAFLSAEMLWYTGSLCRRCTRVG